MFGNTSVLLLEAAKNLISELTDMLLQRIATVETFPKPTCTCTSVCVCAGVFVCLQK